MDEDKNAPKGNDDDELGSDYHGSIDESHEGAEDEDPLMSDYETNENDEDDEELEEVEEIEEVEDDDESIEDDEYQFRDENEVNELDLEEEEGKASGGIMDKIRGFIEPMVGEENFDRLKGMAIPVVVVTIFVIFAVTKLSSLFATPTQPSAANQPAVVQTQITQVKTPKKLITTEITRPGDEPKPGALTSDGKLTGMGKDSGDQPTLPAGFDFSAPAEPGATVNSQAAAVAASTPEQSSSIASGLRSLLGGGDSGQAQFFLQPGKPGYTTAVPTDSAPGMTENVLKLMQESQESQSEKINQHLSELDEQSKGMDERLLRLEKMQESLDTKMTSINEQLGKVGQSLASLSKSLNDKPARAEFTVHESRADGAPSRAGAAASRPPRPQPRSEPAYAAQSQPHPGAMMGDMDREMQPSPTNMEFETPYYHVEAVVPGRAWLKDQNGTTVTVGKGDQIRGYGYVTYIDSENGLVVTSSGIVIRYGIDTR